MPVWSMARDPHAERGQIVGAPAPARLEKLAMLRGARPSPRR